MTTEIDLYSYGRKHCILTHGWAGDLPMAVRYKGRTYVRYGMDTAYDECAVTDLVLGETRDVGFHSLRAPRKRSSAARG
jgi:hypothetical protein